MELKYDETIKFLSFRKIVWKNFGLLAYKLRYKNSKSF